MGKLRLSKSTLLVGLAMLIICLGGVFVFAASSFPLLTDFLYVAWSQTGTFGPLDGVEKETLLSLDFEDQSVSLIEPVYTELFDKPYDDTTFYITSKAGEVISGQYSLVITTTKPKTELLDAWVAYIFANLPNNEQLEPGVRYELSYDVRIIEADPNSLVYSVFQTPTGGFTENAGALQWIPFEPGEIYNITHHCDPLPNYADFKVMFGGQFTATIVIDNLELRKIID